MPWRGLLLAYGAGQLRREPPDHARRPRRCRGEPRHRPRRFRRRPDQHGRAVLLYRIVSFWGYLPVGWLAWAGLTWHNRRVDRAVRHSSLIPASDHGPRSLGLGPSAELSESTAYTWPYCRDRPGVRVMRSGVCSSCEEDVMKEASRHSRHRAPLRAAGWLYGLSQRPRHTRQRLFQGPSPKRSRLFTPARFQGERYLAPRALILDLHRVAVPNPAGAAQGRNLPGCLHRALHGHRGRTGVVADRQAGVASRSSWSPTRPGPDSRPSSSCGSRAQLVFGHWCFPEAAIGPGESGSSVAAPGRPRPGFGSCSASSTETAKAVAWDHQGDLVADRPGVRKIARRRARQALERRGAGDAQRLTRVRIDPLASVLVRRRVMSTPLTASTHLGTRVWSRLGRNEGRSGGPAGTRWIEPDCHQDQASSVQ